jgi:hypothetical protein
MCKNKNYKLDKIIDTSKTISIDMQKFENKLDQEIISIVDQVSLDNIKTKLNYKLIS